MILPRNRLTCWTKPSNCDADLSTVDVISGLIAPTSLYRDDRRIIPMPVMDRAATSRTMAQQIQSVTHHTVSARAIRRHLQQSGKSARRPLLHLPLTGYHRRLRHQWCDKQWTWTTEWNDIVFTDESCICLQHRDGRIRV
ncbi:transposable element Tcb1 transposase [Trichonephila clavipes]|nr:transposable element Tcb1 transposase [Trichonephila clavipes]